VHLIRISAAAAKSARKHTGAPIHTIPLLRPAGSAPSRCQSHGSRVYMYRTRTVYGMRIVRVQLCVLSFTRSIGTVYYGTAVVDPVQLYCVQIYCVQIYCRVPTRLGQPRHVSIMVLGRLQYAL
jgi:hypothetical protein